MTDAGRQASAVDDTHLIFTGATVTAEAPLVLDAAVTFEVPAPAGIAGEYASNAAHFGAAPPPANFSGLLAGSTGPATLGCGQSAPARKSGREGTSVSRRVEYGGQRILQQK